MASSFGKSGVRESNRAAKHSRRLVSRFRSSKRTNLTPFNPYECAADRAFKRHERDIEAHEQRTGGKKGPLVVAEQLHPDFIMPVSPRDVRRQLRQLPAKCLHGLRAIFLLGGSSKQDKVSDSSLSTFGMYGEKCVYLHPYPERSLEMCFPRAPQPHRMWEYRRAGARCNTDAEGTWVRFTPEALRRFYLQDVLVHELGHHVDRFRADSRSYEKGERYAEWFASAYGFGVVPRGPQR